ncbi:hypothetical protein COT44_00895 [Candidatus Shapirobacteria bacterium CG08_land_8_20_14_0_20_39_18]|uniref:Glycosyltransferase 2-like domain-containing protein n=1 Tax=Candidatus Shapirobacteria bacterium CG08_land_8_20_14_0_20_39_18 TaxID=1974883 RepID=A0A2M6XDU1_9BACT|nr:MAG: hypothetical protein COT44_00895 [Candidatus Shapirobacteria bacterium CG08_land_8_20_14_0_20_39_18]PJE68607.1 MAG: hypothetical protein COU94_00970 [Candidatus Shapirobacteria bacterium CG10_big_fil_rev_8_21_14_0_10_38_8]
MPTDISIIVPAYNEEKLLPSFLNDLIFCLKEKNIDDEIIIIENGSKDKTLEIARSFSKKNNQIKTIHLAKPSFGQALRNGMMKAKGEYLVIFNVDFWDKKFLDLTKLEINKHDIIVGSKNLSQSGDNRPLVRRITTRGLGLILQLFFRYKGTDTHGIKIMNRKKILPILKQCKLKSGMIESELLIRAQRNGLRITEIPVKISEHRPNRFGYQRIFKTPGDIISLFLVFK